MDFTDGFKERNVAAIPLQLALPVVLQNQCAQRFFSVRSLTAQYCQDGSGGNREGCPKKALDRSHPGGPQWIRMGIVPVAGFGRDKIFQHLPGSRNPVLKVHIGQW